MRRAIRILGLACWAIASAGRAGEAPLDGTEFIPLGMYGGGTSHNYRHDNRPAPNVKFDFSPALEGLEGLSYAAGANIQITVSIRAEGTYNRGVRKATGHVTVETTEGKTILRLRGHLDSRNDPELTESFTLDPGSYRIAVKGEGLQSYFSLRSYVVRSKPFDVLSEGRVAAERAKQWPPRFEGEGLKVGVVADGYGSEGLLRVLKNVKGIQAISLRRVTEEFLTPCDVAVLPWRRMAAPLSAQAAVALDEFVGQGGGLLVTHDSVGFRGQPALFTDLCPGGAERVESTKWVATVKHPLTEGLGLGRALPHGYGDYIALRIGPSGKALADGVAKANGDRTPVLVCGEYGQGRYVACGLALGVDSNEVDQDPRDAELRLLLNAVRWLGREAR